MSQGSGFELRAATEAGEAFGAGYHCAEAVAQAVLDALGLDSGAAVPCATAFGGGMGRSFQETCGALTGALVAVGMAHGRRAPGQDWNLAAELAAELREVFLRHHGTTHCATLRERFGPEAQMDRCRELVRLMAAEATALLLETAAEHEPLEEGHVPAC